MTNKRVSPLKQIARFHGRNPAIAAVVWLFAIATGLLFSWPSRAGDLSAFVAFSSAVGGLAIAFLALYEAALLARMNAVDGGPDWTVQVNDVTVGSISDVDYAKIRHAVFFDVRTYVAQLMNFGSIINRLIDHFVITIPLVVFWGVVACYFFAPSTFAEVLDAIRKITPVEVSAAMPHIVKLFGVLAALVIGVHTTMGRSFGFINRFEVGCNNHLRQLVECPAEGRITLQKKSNKQKNNVKAESNGNQ